MTTSTGPGSLLVARPGSRIKTAADLKGVFQEPRLLPWKRVAVNVALGLRDRAANESARNALDEVGLSASADAWPVTLSGGEAQRAAFARAGSAS